VIYDSSALAAFFLNEEGRPTVQAVLQDDSSAFTFDSGLVEVANALWKRCLLGKIAEKQAILIQAEIDLSLRENVPRVLPSAPLLMRAIEISIHHGLPAYDSIFIAGCIRFRQRLVSLDVRQKSVASEEKVKLFDFKVLEL
jgi:predicted nucleic acid-binding protein